MRSFVSRLARSVASRDSAVRTMIRRFDAGKPMTLRSFILEPFPGEDSGPGLMITGTIGRLASTFSVRCALLSDLAELAIPAPASLPGRKDRLWEETCFELFLGVKDSKRYWEFHLSPAGHWNVYRFTSYRKGMREEPAFASLPFRVRTEPEVLGLSLDLNLGKIIPAGKAMEVAVSAVIKTVRGRTSHWALAHPGPRPDFHRRDGFLLTIS
jgi:hypothetical protein